MVKSKDIQEITRQILEDCFYQYFSKPRALTKHLVLDRLFPEERRVTSIISGLQTSLGTMFFEALSRALSERNNLIIKDNSTLQEPTGSDESKELDRLIQDFARKRVEGNVSELTDLKQELNQNYPVPAPGNIKFKKMKKGYGCDLILVKGNETYILDLKTVQVNAGFGNNFNRVLISWTTYYKYQHGNDANAIHAKLAFPYNSSNELDDAGWWEEFGERAKPLTKRDAFVGNEFWSFLTDNPDALKNITSGIDTLANESDFCKFFKMVFGCKTSDERKAFIWEVKKRKIHKQFGVKPCDPQVVPVDNRRRPVWEHGDCHFKEGTKKLFEQREYECPECGQSLPASNSH